MHPARSIRPGCSTFRRPRRARRGPCGRRSGRSGRRGTRPSRTRKEPGLTLLRATLKTHSSRSAGTRPGRSRRRIRRGRPRLLRCSRRLPSPGRGSRTDPLLLEFHEGILACAQDRFQVGHARTNSPRPRMRARAAPAAPLPEADPGTPSVRGMRERPQDVCSSRPLAILTGTRAGTSRARPASCPSRRGPPARSAGGASPSDEAGGGGGRPGPSGRRPPSRSRPPRRGTRAGAPPRKRRRQDTITASVRLPRRRSRPRRPRRNDRPQRRGSAAPEHRTASAPRTPRSRSRADRRRRGPPPRARRGSEPTA